MLHETITVETLTITILFFEAEVNFSKIIYSVSFRAFNEKDYTEFQSNLFWFCHYLLLNQQAYCHFIAIKITFEMFPGAVLLVLYGLSFSCCFLSFDISDNVTSFCLVLSSFCLKALSPCLLASSFWEHVIHLYHIFLEKKFWTNTQAFQLNI